MNPDSATFWEHIEDLRQTLLRIIGIIAFGFTLSLLFYKPLLQHLIQNEQLKIFGPLEGMAITLKLSLYSSIALTSPFWLYLILAFIAPALQTPRFLLRFWALATTLFFSGLAFAWTITIPCAIHFLKAFNDEIGDNLWGLSQYIDFTIILLLANGVAFASTSILAFLVHFGTITATQLSNKRRHAIVAIFILSAILTPPDVFTQFLLAIPLMGLYEAVIFYARTRSRAGRGRLAS